MIQYKDNGNLSVVHALGAVVATSDTNSASADLKEHDSALLIANFGVTGDTLSSSVKVEAEVQHSDDNSSWSACADADISSSVSGTNTGTFAVVDAAADDDATYTTSYLGRERYVRIVYNFTGTHSNGIEIAGNIVRGRAKY